MQRILFIIFIFANFGLNLLAQPRPVLPPGTPLTSQQEAEMRARANQARPIKPINIVNQADATNANKVLLVPKGDNLPDSTTDITTPIFLDYVPMENIFYNTLWGSVSGGFLAASILAIQDNVPIQDRLSSKKLGAYFGAGATIGAVIGLIAGTLITFNNIKFPYPDMLDKVLYSDKIYVSEDQPAAKQPIVTYQYKY